MVNLEDIDMFDFVMLNEKTQESIQVGFTDNKVKRVYVLNSKLTAISLNFETIKEQ